MLSKEITTEFNMDKDTPSFRGVENDEYFRVTNPGELLNKIIYW
jgi:hypothetical protein